MKSLSKLYIIHGRLKPACTITQGTALCRHSIDSDMLNVIPTLSPAPIMQKMDHWVPQNNYWSSSNLMFFLGVGLMLIGGNAQNVGDTRIALIQPLSALFPDPASKGHSMFVSKVGSRCAANVTDDQTRRQPRAGRRSPIWHLWSPHVSKVSWSPGDFPMYLFSGNHEEIGLDRAIYVKV